MSYQLIKPEFNSDTSITLWCRDSDFKKHKIKVIGFKPYFYVLNDAPALDSDHILDTEEGFEAVYGEKVKKIICDNPLSVWDSKRQHGLREKFDKVWEADIPFLRRFLIDLGLTDGFTLLNESDVVRYTDIIPSNSPTEKALTVMLDIEVIATGRFPDPEQAANPVTITTLWDNISKKYLQIILDARDYQEWASDDWLIVHVTDENKLLNIISQYFAKIQPDVITGWNVGFDIEYLKNRCIRKQIPLSFEGSCVFNMIDGYAIIHKRLGNRLKEVAEEDKEWMNGIYLEFKQEYWSDPTLRHLGLKANHSHVQVLVIEDERRHIIPFFWGLKQFVGLENMDGTTSHGILIDTLFLREAKGRYVLPSSFEHEAKAKGKGFRGAVVLEPIPGIHEKVGAYDMSRYYPNIVIGYKVSPDAKGELGPNVCKRLMKQRDKFEFGSGEGMQHFPGMKDYEINSTEYNELKERRDEVKYLLNSVWGYYGWSGSRVFQNEKAAFVARKAREGLLYIKAVSEAQGLKVLGGDTDSIYLLLGEINSGKVTGILNDALKEYSKKEGINVNLSIKLEHFYGKLLLTEAMKRSAGRVLWEGGKDCDYIEVKGWDSIRRDSSHLTREVLPKVFDAILRSGTDGLIAYLDQTAQKIKHSDFDVDFIAINKQLHKKDLAEPTLDFYTGSVYANKHFGFDIRTGDMIKVLPVKMIYGYPATNVLCYMDKESVPWKRIVIDYDRIITRTLKNRVKGILKLAGMSWDDVEGTKKLTAVFG